MKDRPTEEKGLSTGFAIFLLILVLLALLAFSVYESGFYKVLIEKVKIHVGYLRPLTPEEWGLCMKDPENVRVTREWEEDMKRRMPDASAQAEGPMIDCNKFRGRVGGQVEFPK